MRELHIAIGITWVLFWVGWLAAAFTAKASLSRTSGMRARGLSVVAIIILLRLSSHTALAVHSVVLGAVGAVLVACGLGTAIWARVHLGRNWGMPTTQRVEPELVTSGPYRFVRHPIYTGLLVAVLGAVLTTDLLGLVVVGVLIVYFYYSASVEERNMTATFPDAYPAYRAHTKMLIPFVL